MLNISPMKYDVHSAFFVDALIQLRRSPSVASLLSGFIATNGYWAHRALLLICECYPLGFFLFYSINKENYMDPFTNMKPNFFMYCGIPLANILLWIFVFVSVRNVGLEFF